MPRTSGAKNKPKDPANELRKVRRLFAKHGKPFPGDLPAASVERAVNGGDDQDAAARSGSGDQAVFVTDTEQQPGSDIDSYECGSCGADLPGAVDVCPECGSQLEWA